MSITPGNSTTVALGTRTNTTVAAPAGTVIGDVIAVSMTAGNGSLTAVTIAPPVGVTYELVGDATVTAPDPYSLHAVTFGIRHDGSALYTFTHASAATQAFARHWIGVDPTVMQDAAATSAIVSGFGTPDTPIVAPSITTVTNGAVSIINRASWDGVAITGPGGWTESHDSPVMWMGYREWPTAGATGTTAVATGNTGDSPRAIIHGVLRPYVAPTTTSVRLLTEAGLPLLTEAGLPLMTEGS